MLQRVRERMPPDDACRIVQALAEAKHVAPPKRTDNLSALAGQLLARHYRRQELIEILVLLEARFPARKDSGFSSAVVA